MMLRPLIIVPDIERLSKARGIVDPNLEIADAINYLHPKLKRLCGSSYYTSPEVFLQPFFLTYFSVDDAVYRRDLHSLLVEDTEFKGLFSSLHSMLPSQNPPNHIYNTDRNGNQLDVKTIRAYMTQIKKFLDMPQTLEKIAELPSQVEAVKDMKKFAIKSRALLNEYAHLAKPLSKELATRIKQDNPDVNYANDCVEKIKPYIELLMEIRAIRIPLHHYLILCKPYELTFNGKRIPSCKPEFLDQEERRGEILSAYNPSEFGFGKLKEENKRVRIITRLNVPNDIIWGKHARNTFIQGPNNQGKSFYERTIGLNVHLPMAGLRPFAQSCTMSPVGRIFTCFDMGSSIHQGGEYQSHFRLGHFLTGAKSITELKRKITLDDLALLDETGSGTEPEAEFQVAKGLSDALIEFGYTSFCVSHDRGTWKEYVGRKGVRIVRVADLDDRKRKFKVWPGIARGGYGMKLAKRKGIDPASIKKALASRAR